jgi:acyl dehydratase
MGPPTLPGDTVRAKLTVTDKVKTSKPDRGVVSLQVRALTQTDAVVMVSTWKMLVRRSAGWPWAGEAGRTVAL